MTSFTLLFSFSGLICQHDLFAHQTVRAMLGLTTLANRNPHGTTTPCYVRLFTARVVEAFGFDVRC